MQFTNVGKLLKIFISNKKDSLDKETNIIRVDTKGILGDKYYDTNINRSILITSTSSYQLAKKYNIDIPLGTLGENLLIDYNPYNLSSGQRIKVGEIILEISQNCTICDHLSKIDKRLPTLLKEDRGIFAKVIKGGDIFIGDEIFILK